MSSNRPGAGLKTLLAGIAALGISMTGPAEAESYLCEPEAATGFHFNEQTQKWDLVNFATSRRYVLSQKDGKWWWVQIGGKVPLQCDDFDTYDGIRCGDFSRFFFNKTTLRYQAEQSPISSTMPRGQFLADSDIWIELGKCSSF